MWAMQKNYQRCGRQRGKPFVKLKLKQFTVLLPTKRKNYQRCRQQHGTLGRVMDNNAEKCSALWATTRKNCHNAERYIF
jgi:hypothetical protein